MIKIFHKISDLTLFRESLPKGQSLGLVPTMGNLHQGHMSLIKESYTKNDKTIVSIFVNPKQFGPSEDFEKYPRTFENDLAEISKVALGDTIYVFAPEINDIYPESFSTEIRVKRYTNILCDKFRPGHFHGVTTIVYRLFSLVKPNNAYFGEKDFQQFKTIEQMTLDLNLPVSLIPMPIIREEDGLAMSSRNHYLKKSNRETALTLSRSIEEAASILKTKGLPESLSYAKEVAKDPQWEYLDIRNSSDLETASQESEELIILGALKVGDTRLIDNLKVTLC